MKFFAFLTMMAVTCSSLAVEEISWDDLLPEDLATIENPFEDMPYEQLNSLAIVARYQDMLSEQVTLSDVEQEEMEQEQANLEEMGVDVASLLETRQTIMEQSAKRAFSTNPDLDGANLKIPGYLLPLEFENDRVTEFLLVPYVGACIHTPPPPPNQIVHVSTELGFATSSLYDPVWVEGVMKNELLESNLSFVDGSADIPVAYTLEASEITPYE